MKIVCFHLFNDYSGSPRVLHNTIEGLLERGYDIDLITSRGGILDTIKHPRLSVRHYGYRFSSNPAVTMLRYAWAQLLTFGIALTYAFRKDTIFYINTILPVGPALAGRLTRKKVIYHYHENASVKSGFYRALCAAMQRMAHRIICVSNYQASLLTRRKDVHVIPNTLDEQFLAQLRPNPYEAFERKTVLMLSSLKAYKGTKEFLQLAEALPDYRFELVINDTQQAINAWLTAECINPAANVAIYPRTTDIASFYNRASLVLNLSNPDLVIETFGLTALEAMADALPVIVPPVGGIAELVDHGVNGYKVDLRDFENLKSKICGILSDKSLYLHLSENAFKSSQEFSRAKHLDCLTLLLK